MEQSVGDKKIWPIDHGTPCKDSAESLRPIVELPDSMSSQGESSKLTVDRSVHVILPLSQGSGTPSSKDGISARIERLHRLHGTSLLASAWKMLLPDALHGQDGRPTSIPTTAASSCFATACTLFHRFYHCVSLTKHCVWSVAMASTLLSAKLDDDISVLVNLSQIILVYSQLYKRRVLLLSVLEDETDTSILSAIKNHDSVSFVECPSAKRQRVLQPVGLSTFGPIYKEWSQVVIDTENQILRHLGFTLYWIADHHAHKYLDHFVSTVNGMDSIQTKEVARLAWIYCNDAYRLDVMTRFHSHVIACAAIVLALLECGVVPDSGSASFSSWIISMCGVDALQNVSDCCNAILGLKQMDEHNDAVVAAFAFVVSLEPSGSFNDPNSFIYDQIKQLVK